MANGDRYVDAHDAHLNMLCIHARNREAFLGIYMLHSIEFMCLLMYALF